VVRDGHELEPVRASPFSSRAASTAAKELSLSYTTTTRVTERLRRRTPRGALAAVLKASHMGRRWLGKGDGAVGSGAGDS
jgi:hypothetical protein